MTISLTGVNPSDPIPALYGEIRFAQGPGGGAAPERVVLIYGNKTSAGSETTNTINTPILDRADCIARFGARSEIRWEWEAFQSIPQQATVYAVAVPEPSSGSPTSATRTFTFATAATGATTLYIEWAGRVTTVGVATGDTAITQAAAAAAAILDWEEGGVPFTAAVGSNPNDHVVTATASQLGERGEHVLNGIRMYYGTSVGTTVTAGTTSAGSGADDFSTAYDAAKAKGLFYYQINPKFATTSPSSTDNGIGEGAAYITAAALPTEGKRQQMFFGLVGTQAQATTVATAVNNPRVKFFWSENNPMFPGMIAALHCAIIRQAEVAFAGANVNGYTANAAIGRLYPMPAPYSSGDYPTRAELVACLNNGISPVAFDQQGRPTLVRHVTSYSLNGSSNDYRVREGHIPSALDNVLDEMTRVYAAAKEALPLHSATDLTRGQRPREGMMYPSYVSGIIRKVITDKSGENGGLPVLDPATLAQQLASVTVESLNDGFNVRADLLAVRHNNKGGILLLEQGPSY